jgi:cytochrome c-type biogenesis protein CcmH/NrfG
MFLIVSLQALMFGGALLLIAAPFVRHHQSILSRNYLTIALLTLLLSTFLYLLNSDRYGLSAWFAGGKEHYQLLETFHNLGGVDSAINSLQKHLMENPKDTQAWIILGKLYLGKQDLAHAHMAFTQAHELNPDNAEITKLRNKNVITLSWPFSHSSNEFPIIH